MTPATGAHSPQPLWAGIELLVAATVIAAGLNLHLTVFVMGSAPWLMAIGVMSFWLRGPRLRAVFLGSCSSVARTLFVGVLVGVTYQFVSTYALEPAIARLTSGELPDVSQFR